MIIQQIFWSVTSVIFALVAISVLMRIWEYIELVWMERRQEDEESFQKYLNREEK